MCFLLSVVLEDDAEDLRDEVDVPDDDEEGEDQVADGQHGDEALHPVISGDAHLGDG